MEMSIHRALAELKLLDKRINKLIETSPSFCLTKKDGDKNINGDTLDQYSKKIQGSFDSIKSLIRRREEIKSKIMYSNARLGISDESICKGINDNKIFQSMSRKGNCLDNSSMENFFGILKQEMYYGVIYHSYEELKTAIEEYIKYYNKKRIKEKLGWISPVDYIELHAVA